MIAAVCASADKPRVDSAAETSTSVKRSPAAMKSAATAAVESSSTATTMAPTTLSERRLRQPTERNHRHQDNTYSKQNGFLHIATLGSTSLQSLDDKFSSKVFKAAFYTHAGRLAAQ
jgi:hypothetical protein